MRELKVIRVDVRQATVKGLLPPKYAVSTGFYLTHNQVETVVSLAEHTGLPISEHVRKAINSYLKDIDTQEEILDPQEIW